MKWYQPIECDKTVKKPLVCDDSNFEAYNFIEYDFMSGKYISEWNDNIFLKASEILCNGKPDDALQNSYMFPVYSERLVSALKDAEIKGIQYLPIKVFDSNDNPFEGFYLANFLNFVEAFDYGKSDFDRFADDFPNPNVRGKIAGVVRFVLKAEMLNGLDIIRLKEYKRRFFISEKFKSVFIKNRFTGYSFREVEIV